MRSEDGSVERPRRPLLAARIGLYAGAALCALGGLLAFWALAPTRMEDETFWHGIDPIPAETARALTRKARTGLALGLAAAAAQIVAAAASSKRWCRGARLGARPRAPLSGGRRRRWP